MEFLIEYLKLFLAGLAIFIAWKGLNTWKNQMHGKDKYTVSKNLLKNVYHLRDNIKSTRQLFVSVHEFGEVPKEGKHSDTYYQMAHAYKNRYDKVMLSRSNLDGFLLDAEVIWGEDVMLLFAKLFKKQFDLSTHIGWYLDSLVDKSYKDIYKKDILYFGLNDDLFSKELEDIINEIEDFLKPNMK